MANCERREGATRGREKDGEKDAHVSSRRGASHPRAYSMLRASNSA